MSESDAQLDNLYGDPYVLAGAWADWTHVHRGRNEFTIDFIRDVPAPPGLTLVARAIVAPVVAVELREQLDQILREYTGWSMPGVDR